MQGRSLGFHHRKIEAEKREFPKSSAQAPVSVHLNGKQDETKTALPAGAAVFGAA